MMPTINRSSIKVSKLKKLAKTFIIYDNDLGFLHKVEVKREYITLYFSECLNIKSLDDCYYYDTEAKKTVSVYLFTPTLDPLS